MGDTADGFPGLPGWGAKSAAAVLRKFGHIEDIPDDPAHWHVKVRSAAALSNTLNEQRADALLFKRIATLERDAPVPDSVDALHWTGPTAGFADVAASIDAPGLAHRADALAASLAG